MSMKEHEFMHGARTLIENATSTPRIAGVLTAYGYTAARVQEGRAMLDAADALMKKKSLAYGKRKEASVKFARTWDKANASYVKALKIARIALGGDILCVASLKLSGARKQAFAGWYNQADLFYQNMLGDKRFTDGLSRFGYSVAALADERALVQEAMKRYRLSARAAGVAAEATAAKNKEFAVLVRWVADFRVVCAVAFSDDKAELAKLGPLAPIRKKRQAKKVML